MIALAALDPSGQLLVGGGIADDATHTITIVADGRVLASVPVVGGVFTIAAPAKFRPGNGVKFIAS